VRFLHVDSVRHIRRCGSSGRILQRQAGTAPGCVARAGQTASPHRASGLRYSALAQFLYRCVLPTHHSRAKAARRRWGTCAF
jgi:hypothetical protein